MSSDAPPPSRKESNGKKKPFRTSTLFPQATFVQQLGLDKLTARVTPPPQADSDQPVSQDTEDNQPDSPTRKATTTGQDNSMGIKQHPTKNSQQNTEGTQNPNKQASNNTSAPPLTAPEVTTNVKNPNGKRYRGNTADAPGADSVDRPPINMRSNTVLPTTRAAPDITLKTIDPTHPTTALKVPALNTPGGLPLMRKNSGPLNSVSTPRHFSNADITNPFEEDDTEENLRTENNKIQAGTFGKIVEKITDDKFGDAQMLVVFLNTYRTFVSPTRLLNILMVRYSTPVRFAENQDHDAKQKAVRLRIMVVFKHWIENHWHDWQENDLLVDEFKKFVHRTVIPSGLQKSADILTHLLDKKCSEVDKDVQKQEANTGKSFDLWSFSTYDIAVQITLIEFNFYKAIKLPEFLKLAWTKKNAKKRAPNILAFIEFFNRMAEWIKAEIITQDVLQRRIEKLAKFLDLAEKLLMLNNFNGVAEVVAALDSAPIYRLKKTWEGLPDAKKGILPQLREIVGPNKSYAKLREKLHNANPPCIPYLGTYLTDLTFIHDGNPDILPETRMVNFGKCVLISDVLREIQLYQQTKFTQVQNPQFKKFIMNFVGFSEEESYDLSLEIEPRARAQSNPEKVETDKGDTKSAKGSRLKLSVITTLESVRPHGPPTPPSPSSKPPQEMLTITNRLVKKRWGKKAWLDLSEEPFYVFFQMLGTSSPLLVRLPPKCTTNHALSIFEDTFRGVAITCKMVVMPTAQYPSGRVLLEDEGLDGYCVDPKKNVGPVLMIFGKPVSVRVGVSRANSVERLEDIILDLSAPIFALIPILQNVFSIKDEFAFLYIEGAAVARWMNMGRTLENQALDPDKGLLLIFPLVNLLHRTLSSLGTGEKGGYLLMKKKSEQGGSYLRGTHRRYFTLHDHFLMWFDNDHPDGTPRGLVSLDHFSAKVGTDKVLTLFRTFKGFNSTISKYNYYKFTGVAEEDTAEWYAVIQECRGSVGDQVIFGIPLAAAVTKRGANNLPIVVLKTITYLTENDFLDEKLFKEQCTAQLLEFYIDQYDQGANVDFTHLRHPASVAQLLVIYLSMLPDPLLTFDLFEQFVQQGVQYLEITTPRRATNDTDRKNIAAKKKSAENRLAALVAQLPPVNRSVLCFLLEFLNEIISKARENCADDSVAYASTRSLAGVFGPTCLRPSPDRGQVAPTRGECELVMQQLILQNNQLFTSGSEVKIIRRAKVKNMLQASTQSIHLTAQIAENAQQLTREPSSTIVDMELKISKDPHENELLQAVYGTLKRKQAIRNQKTRPDVTPPGTFSFSPPSSPPISPPTSPPSSSPPTTSVLAPSGNYRFLPRPPSPPCEIDDEVPVSFIPPTLPPPTPPPANLASRPSSPPPLTLGSARAASPLLSSSGPARSLSPTPAGAVPSLSLTPALTSSSSPLVSPTSPLIVSPSYLGPTATTSLITRSPSTDISNKQKSNAQETPGGPGDTKNVGKKSDVLAKSSDKIPEKIERTRGFSDGKEKPIAKAYEKPAEKQPDKATEKAAITKPTEKTVEKSGNNKPAEKAVEKVIEKPAAPKPQEKWQKPQEKLQEKTQEKPAEKPHVAFTEPTKPVTEHLAKTSAEKPTGEKTTEQLALEKMLEKPWPKPPPMPPHRLSRRISALRKFDRDRSSKKNSKPPIDIFEGEPVTCETNSFRERMANLRNMFEQPGDTPKLPTSNSKLFPNLKQQ